MTNLTKEQIEEAKENSRKWALKNLKALDLMNLASAFLVHKSKAYGQSGDSAVQEFKYWPSFNSDLKANNLESGEEYNVFKNAILKSREEDEIYSGNFKEKEIMKDCAQIMQTSLNQIKVSDLYKELMGGSKTIPKEMGDKYIGELIPKMSEEEINKLTEDKKKILQKNMEFYQILTESYKTDLMDKAVSESIGERRKQNLKGLEEILMGGN
ncbi:MAG: hypothetical protein Q8O84_01345 [Nanoarchaeota archaeon]|nr:hypothetical protein [Nanoarchaeota archaeon]